MPEYYRDIFLDLKDVNELDFGFYYDSKRHRYRISVNYGEHYIDVTRKEGETIFKFLCELKEFLGSRKDFRNRSAIEESFDYQEDHPGSLRSFRPSSDEEFFDAQDDEESFDDGWEEDFAEVEV